MRTGARERGQLAAAGVLGAHADEHHEERGQWCGQQQHQADDPVDREHRGEDRQWHGHDLGARGEIAAVIAGRRIHMAGRQGDQRAAALTAQPQRAAIGHRAGESGTQACEHRFHDVRLQPLALPGQQRARQQRRGEQTQRRLQRGEAGSGEQQRIERPGDRRGLGDPKPAGEHDARARRAVPAAQRGEPRVEPAAALPALRGGVRGWQRHAHAGEVIAESGMRIPQTGIAARHYRRTPQPTCAPATGFPLLRISGEEVLALLRGASVECAAHLRGVAQSGRALRSGRRGRRFESCLPDQPQQCGR